jgi:hypothetical protein
MLPILPVYLAEIEAKHGLPRRSLLRILLPGGWGYYPRFDMVTLKRVRARLDAYYAVLAKLEEIDATEQAVVERLIRLVERKERVLTARVGRLDPEQVKKGAPRKVRWIGDRVAEVYALLDRHIPAQRRRGRSDESLTEPRSYKTRAAQLTAEIIMFAYGADPHWRGLRLTAQDVKNRVAPRGRGSRAT